MIPIYILSSFVATIIFMVLSIIFFMGRRQIDAKLQDTQLSFDALQEQYNALRHVYEQLRDERNILIERNNRLVSVEQQLQEYKELSDRYITIRSEMQARQEHWQEAQKKIQSYQEKCHALESSYHQLNAQFNEIQARREMEQKQADEKLQLMQDAKNHMLEQFKNLAQEIFDEKSKRFSAQNQENIQNLIDPIKIKLREFHEKIDRVYVEESKDRSRLTQQVEQMMHLNQKISQEAHNLTEALRGSNKSQGTWGELLLERVLEASGLRKGEEYRLQETFSPQGSQERFRPDVVVYLPEDRHILIDAKMSLLAYERFYHASDAHNQQQALKAHIDSIRQHVKLLSEKNYQNLEGVCSLDFVVMFIPVDAAFMAAVNHDSNLYLDAWKKNILLASPATLLFVIRTVAHLWRQEAQNKNAQDIAAKGADLYDKLAGFIDDLEQVGFRLKQAQDSYDKSLSKLKGKGGAIRQAKLLTDLGVKPKKTIKFTDDTLTDNSHPISSTIESLENHTQHVVLSN